jgi:SAM-dependent methyltransferase
MHDAAKMIDKTHFKDKASKNPDELRLYEDADYITAYSRHTDLRIERDGYQLAIGATARKGQGWDEHGQLQLDFLISHGLTPDKTLLDFGCGTGRLACKAIPYLEKGHYIGIDISNKAIENCRQITTDLNKLQLFTVGNGSLPLYQVDFIWAHSVINHSPPEIVEQLFSQLRDTGFSKFLFTYREGEERRLGLKQFAHPYFYFNELAVKHGFKCSPIDFTWPASQRTILITP